MEYTTVKGLNRKVSRIGLGTWAIGGFNWGGTDEREALETIRTALDHGITLIDTAPVYGLGNAEELVGRALAQYGKREQVIIATKVGLSGARPRCFATRVERGSRTKLMTRCAACRPITSTSIKFIGRTLLFQLKRQQPRCSSSINKEKSAPLG